MSVDGTYDVTINAPVGERKATLMLDTSEGGLVGKMENAEGDTDQIFDGEITGNTLSWKAKIQKPMQITLKFEGTSNGDQIDGTVALGPLGNAPFRAIKTA